ncbi:YraN family protein [Candidatus Daviesbacteria bacterium]|nr:YraN family protein [Candidatus Daviesbacteria bacterium]
MYTKATGNYGEELACQYLRKIGYKILERNYRIRGGEIDIVCLDQDYLVFVEVKTRYSHEYGLPKESITSWKIKALLKTAQFYLQKANWENKGYRLDLVTIDFANNPQKPEIELIKDITS